MTTLLYASEVLYEMICLSFCIASIIFLYFVRERDLVKNKEAYPSLPSKIRKTFLKAKDITQNKKEQAVGGKDFSNNLCYMASEAEDEFRFDLIMSQNAEIVSKTEVVDLTRKICAASPTKIEIALKLYRNHQDKIEDEFIRKGCPYLMNYMYRLLIGAAIWVYNDEKAFDVIVEVVEGSMKYFKNLQALPLKEKETVGETEEECLQWVIRSKEKLAEAICKLSVHNKRFSLLLKIYDHFGVFEIPDSSQISDISEDTESEIDCPPGLERDSEEAELNNLECASETKHVEKLDILSYGLVKRPGFDSQCIWSCLFKSSIEGRNQLNIASGIKNFQNLEVIPESTTFRQGIRFFCKMPQPSQTEYSNIIRLLKFQLQSNSDTTSCSQEGTELSSVYVAALELFERLKTRGSALPPSQFTEWFQSRENLLINNFIICICVKNGTITALQKAVQVLEQILEMREKITDVNDKKEMMPDTMMYSTVVRGILLNTKKGKISEVLPLEKWALKHFAMISLNSQCYVHTGIVLLEHLCYRFLQSGSVASIDEYNIDPLAILRNLTHFIGEDSKFSICSRIPSMLIRYYTGWNGFGNVDGEELGQLNSAIDVYMLWVNYNNAFFGSLDPSCHKLLIMFCSRQGRVQSAYEILQKVAKIPTVPMDEFYCNYVLNGLLKEKPVDIAEKAEAIVSGIMLSRSIPVCSTTLSILINIKIAADDLQGAFHILKHRAKNEFKSTNVELRLYIQLANAAASRREGEIAFEAYSMMCCEYNSLNSSTILKMNRKRSVQHDVFSKEVSNFLLWKLYSNGCVTYCKRLSNFMEKKKILHDKNHFYAKRAFRH